MSAVQEIIGILDLEPLEVNLFRGHSPQNGWKRVFGGQVVGQALAAACRTVDDVMARPPHSLHAYFLLGGDPKVPIIYEVDRIRDGKSFTTRNVKAIQHGQAIFSMSASFHGSEPGLSHQFKMPDVPKPDALPNEAELKEKIYPLLPEAARRYYARERPIEFKPVEFSRYLGKRSDTGRFDIWIRANGRLPDAARDPSMRAGLRVRHDAARRCTDPARPQRILRRHHGGEPRPRDVVSPPVPRRRMAALFARQPEPCRLPRVLPWSYLRNGRHTGRVGGPGRPAAAAPA